MEPYSFNRRAENLLKSYFNDYKNVSYRLDADKINIHLIEEDNVDSASLELIKDESCFKIYFWDGYSQSEVIEVATEKDAFKTLKRFLKKLIKILNR